MDKTDPKHTIKPVVGWKVRLKLTFRNGFPKTKSYYIWRQKNMQNVILSYDNSEGELST